MKGSEVFFSFITGTVLFSLTKLYNASVYNLYRSTLATGSTPETFLRSEISNLELQKKSLILSVTELRLSHERSVRLRAIDLARSMILDRRQQKPQITPPITNDQLTKDPSVWCSEAARRFNMTLPISNAISWGSMVAQVYRSAWISHNCEDRLSPPNPISRPTANQRSGSSTGVALMPTPPSARHFAYLKNPSASGNRRKVTVVVWNKIRGFLDWLRPDFTSAAREQCSTECIFTDNKNALSSAEGVLFHVKTHSSNDFPRRAHPQQKYIILASLLSCP